MYKEFVQRVICLTFFLNGTFLHSKNVTLILNPVDYYFFLSKVHKEKKTTKNLTVLVVFKFMPRMNKSNK